MSPIPSRPPAKRRPADFHSHILPQMDDGSDSVETSLGMLAQSAAYGVSVMVATPHFYAGNEAPESFLARREISARRLLRGGYDPSVHPRVCLGAEVAYFTGIGRCADLERLAILGTRTVMIEMPSQHWTEAMVEDVFSIHTRLGLLPVLVHMERYSAFYHPGMLRMLTEGGVVLQMNASMFANRLTRRLALRMLTKGDIQLLGSDCHNLDSRPPNFDVALRYLEEHAEETLLPQLIEFNRFVLSGAITMDKAVANLTDRVRSSGVRE